MLQVYAQETTFSDKKYDYCMAQRHFEHKIKDYHFKSENRDEDRPAVGVSSKRNEKGKKEMPTTTPRLETASVGPQGVKVHVEKRAHPSMTRT